LPTIISRCEIVYGEKEDLGETPKDELYAKVREIAILMLSKNIEDKYRAQNALLELKGDKEKVILILEDLFKITREKSDAQNIKCAKMLPKIADFARMINSNCTFPSACYALVFGIQEELEEK
jgi:hypothetical protein